MKALKKKYMKEKRWEMLIDRWQMTKESTGSFGSSVCGGLTCINLLRSLLSEFTRAADSYNFGDENSDIICFK